MKPRSWNLARRWLSISMLALGLGGLIGGSIAQDDASSDPLAEMMSTGTGEAMILELTGPIGPALSHYIVEGIEGSQDAGAIILEMDTPGGLDTSMREIIQAILASDVPVMTYVSPSGARAASAGAFILYASHVAAMAPGTAVGAATPVQMGGGESPVPSSPPEEGTEEATEPEPIPEGSSATAPRTPLDAKAMNDALALARGLAELRGRNVEFAEAMIRDAESISYSEALEMGVIEFVVRNPSELLDAANGMVVDLDGTEVTLDTEGLELTRQPMNWVQEFISLLTNPNVAFILMNFGMLGILVELYNPGSILPGVVGVICLVLALYSLSVLPFNATGLTLLVVGLLLMGAELFITSGGILAIGGFIAFAIGAFFLFDSPVAAFRLDLRVLLPTLIAFGAALFFVVSIALRSFGRKVAAGPEQLIGMTGRVVEWSGGKGFVFMDGETWQSRFDGELEEGQDVVAIKRDGNFLIVKPAK